MKKAYIILIFFVLSCSNINLETNKKNYNNNYYVYATNLNDEINNVQYIKNEIIENKIINKFPEFQNYKYIVFINKETKKREFFYINIL
tara:strand:+ start:592 stop:858 length:267 start_codon:yes stop_codon:yes gene_type:complete